MDLSERCCGLCGGFIPAGISHICATAPPLPLPVQPLFALANRIADALERIADSLERSEGDTRVVSER